MNNISMPALDRRVLYGIKDDPKIFIIGSAAEGIIKTVKKLTPLENITPVEINPAILEIMQKDFYKSSGKAYNGLSPKLGNAISILRESDQKYDILTLINTHSTRNISRKGAPDYLHTKENYNLYLNHLTDKGYMLFEERPINRNGKLGLYRMINTLWHTLKERGVKNPSKHFAIWEWMGRRIKKIKKEHSSYYVSMIVTKKPIEKSIFANVVKWLTFIKTNKKSTFQISYLKDYKSNKEYRDLFNMIETNNFSALQNEDFDSSIITNNRPFSAMSKNSIPIVNKLLLIALSVFAISWIFFSILLKKNSKNRSKELFVLNIYNVLIGMSYFLIEIILIQKFQNLFISPSFSMVFVLGGLLISSGIGGVFLSKLKLSTLTIILLPLVFLAVFLPDILVDTGLPFILIQIIGITLLLCTGLLMGAYFPKGLAAAKYCKTPKAVPTLFAINSVAGSFAVIFALFLGIKIGYQFTVYIACISYLLAGFLLKAYNLTPTESNE